MTADFVLPGTLGPRLTARRTLLGGARLLVDWQPARSKGLWKGSYEVRFWDGRTREVRVEGLLSSLKLIVDGVEYPLEEPLVGWQKLLVMLPLALVLGGWLGGLVGALAALINARLVRTRKPAPVRGAAMIGVGLGGLGVYLGLALGIWFVTAPIPEYEVGACLDWRGEIAATATADEIRVVDCGVPHAGEVVARPEHPGATSYPGEDALLAWAWAPCIAGFRDYVGSEYWTSSLDLALLYPSDILWLKGDRTLECVAVDMAGGRLIGSVRDSHR